MGNRKTQSVEKEREKKSRVGEEGEILYTSEDRYSQKGTSALE